MRTGRKHTEPSEGISGQTAAELKSAMLWFLEVLIAVVFGLSGVLKISKPVEYLSGLGMHSAIALPEWAVHFVGMLEIVSSIALLVPAMLGVLVFLAPLASVVLLIVQAFTILLELGIASADYTLPINAALLGCLTVVTWYRFQPPMKS